MNSIGEKIKQLRIEYKLTQKQLADLSKISESSIKQYELGGRVPKMQTLDKIASVFNMSGYELVNMEKILDAEDTICHENTGIGSKIARIAKEKKISIKELSRRANVPYTTLYSMIKRDSNSADMINLIGICDVLDIPIESLLESSNQLTIKKELKDKVDKEHRTMSDDEWTKNFLELIKDFDDKQLDRLESYMKFLLKESEENKR